MIEPRVAQALGRVAEALKQASDPWWIIGSAAVALHDGNPGPIGDIDVVLSRRDLDALYKRLPLSNTPDEGKLMFTSERFGRWSEPELDAEFMAGLKLLEGGEWSPITLQTRLAFRLGKHTLYVPEKAELVAMLHRFGREKDFARAATIGG